MIERKLRGYVFTWNHITENGNNNQILKTTLKVNSSVSWINEDSKFIKNDNNTITLLLGSRSLSLVLDYEKKKVNLITSNTSELEFDLKDEDGELNVYLKQSNNILTVWFNAWRYEREEQFALVAIMKTIGYAMEGLEAYKEIIPILLRGIGIVGRDILRNLAIRYAMTEKGLKELENKLLPKMDVLSKVDKDTIYFDGIDTIEKAMRKVTKTNRIVVFVDDLDRCSPKKALEVFESIKIFLDIEGFVFIIGLSPEIITKVISQEYKEIEINAEEYLHKIIQTQVQIPDWDSQAIANLIDLLSSRLNSEYSKDIIKEQNKELVLKIIEQNPRQVKRFLNSLVLAVAANRLEPETFLVVEVLNRKWTKFQQDLDSDREFRELAKEFAHMKKNSRLTKLADEKSKENPSSQIKKLLEIDDDLWNFLDHHGILPKIIEDWDVYSHARQSVKEIPVPTSQKQYETKSQDRRIFI